MKRVLMLFLPLFLCLLLISSPILSVEFKKNRSNASFTGENLDVSVRLIGGKGAIFKPGRDISITFQVNRDAYVIIYNIDSEGYVQLLFPADGNPVRVKGGKVHFLPQHGSGVYLEAGHRTGIEYIHAMAVTERDRIKEEELYFLARSGKMPDEKRFRIDMDPFLAFNMIDEEIVIEAENQIQATDFTYFYINRKVEYPRYLCAKCHGENKITDPYAMECPEITIEKIAYEEDLKYPYSPLFNVRHAGEDEEIDYYASSNYAESVTDDWDDEEDDNATIYLSIYYSGYDYPHRYYWPYYRYHIITYSDPWMWDPYWGFGFTWYWGDYYYHHRPFYTWWYPYDGYWAYHYWHDCCGCYYTYNNYSRRHIYADRSLTKRNLSYKRTLNKTSRDRTIADSRLGRKQRTERDSRVVARSSLAKRVSRGDSGRLSRTRRTIDAGRSKELRRRVIYGGDQRARRTRDTRDAKHTRDARDTRPADIRKDRGKRDALKGRDTKRRTTDRTKPSKETRSSRRLKTKPRSKSGSSDSSSQSGKSVRRPSKSSGSSKSSPRSKRSSPARNPSARRSPSNSGSSSPSRPSGRGSSRGSSSSRSSRSSGGSSSGRKR